MTRVLTIIFSLLVVLIVAVCACGYWIYSSVTTPHEHAKANEYIRIEKGSTPRQIIDQLTEAGVIRGYVATMIYLRTVGDTSKLQAGEYQFPSPITTLAVIKQLEKGQDLTMKLTIPEGYTRFDIAKRIAERFPQNPPIDDKAALALMDDTTLIHDIAPEAKN